MQQALYLHNGRTLERSFPDPSTPVTGHVCWGRFDAFLTPAFWANRCWMWSEHRREASHRLGRSLLEETAACLLGGHGIPAEIGLAAFRRLQESGLLAKESVDANGFLKLLLEPLNVEGRKVRYRFARQKAVYLADMHRHFKVGKAPPEHVALRDWLLQIKGIGPKTASWTVRNWHHSDEVAILDIHIYRAGLIAGVFTEDETPERHYFSLERKFLDFAKGLGVKPSILDAVIWDAMRDMPLTVHEALQTLQEALPAMSAPKRETPRTFRPRRTAHV